jgi:addiction module HigA family antidote
MMLPTNRPPVSPGEMLQHFIEEYGLTQTKLAEHLGWTTTKVNQIVRNRRAVTPETALCLSDAFGNTAQFWLNSQHDWDLWHALRSHKPIARVEAVGIPEPSQDSGKRQRKGA